MNEKSFEELFALVHDTSPTSDVPAEQQGHVHKTMSDMVAAAPGTSDPCVLLGFLEPGDGGGGVFRHDAAALKEDHDGSLIVDITKSYSSHADFLDTGTNNMSGTGCWIRQTNTTTPEMWGAKGDGTTDDSVAWNAFARSLAKNGGKGELSGNYLISSAAEVNINKAGVVVEIVGTSDAAQLYGGGSGVTLFKLLLGNLIVRDLRLKNITLFFSARETNDDFDSVVLENVSFDNTGAHILSAALKLEAAGSAIPKLKYFRAVGVRIEGGVGGIEIETPIEEFHVDDYVCRNITVPDNDAHFKLDENDDLTDDMKNLGYASGLSLGADSAELVELTRHGYIGSIVVDGVQDDRQRRSTGTISNVDGVRIHAFNVNFDNIHVQNVDSHSKVDCTALYLKAHRCRGDRFTAIDAGFHEGMLTLKGARRSNSASNSPGFNVSINDVQLIGTQEGFSGRAGVFCGVDDVHIGRLYMENIGGAVEDPYNSGTRLTGQGQLFQGAAPDATAMQRLSVGRIEAVNCDLGNEAGNDIRAVELKGYREIQIGRIIFDGVTNSGGFSTNTERLVLVGIFCDVLISHCDIGGILERNTQLSGTQTETTMLEIDSRTTGFGQLVLREAFVTSSVFDIGIKTLGTASIGLLDIAGGDLSEIGSSLLDTSAKQPGEIHIRGVGGLADLPAPGENDPVVSTFTGDGSETDFTLSSEPVSEAAILVLVDGVVQHGTAYSLADDELSFTAAPAIGAAIEVRDLSLTAIADPEAVATVANIATEVQTVAGIPSEISAVAADATDIGTVGAAIADVSTVAADIADVTVAADNMAAIQAAPAAATSAASSATAAAASASTAGDAAEDAAAAALTAATVVTAQARFQNRFVKLPPSVLGLDLGEMSQVDLARSTIGTRIDPRGGPEVISANLARLTHDPDSGEPLGLLLEPAAENLVRNSEDLTSASGSVWALGHNLSRDTAITDPFGTTKAIRLTADGNAILTNATPYFRSFTSSGTFTNGVSSWWVRRVSGSGSVRILGLNNSHSQTLDIGSQIDATWRRFAHDGPPGGSFYYAGIAVMTDGDAVEVAFPQIEDIAGTIPSSYIPTTGSAVTRDADAANIDLTAVRGFRPEGFSTVVEAVLGGVDGTLISIGTGTTSEIAVELDSGTMKLTGADSLDLTAASGLSVGDSVTVALRILANDVAVSVGGATVVTDSSHSMNGGSDEMSLGADLTGADNLPCIIRQIAFFGPLDDATLEAMSGS
ncbi:MAG: hypothetical protein P1U37_12510 [Minwuia sp.]|nr:hypothetical protein [Minwuia sp.]